MTSKYFPDPCTVDEMSQKSLKQGVVYFSAFDTFLPLFLSSDFKIVFRIEIREKTSLKMALKNLTKIEILKFSKVIQKFNSQPISISKTILD